MSNLPTLPGLTSAISLPGLAAGPMPCVLPGGIAHAGPAALPASLSLPQAKVSPATTRDISPPNLSAWSGPAAPQCCLANRSQARMCSERLQAALESRLKNRLGHGSMIYQTVWKPHVTPLGRQISRLRASALRTSVSELSLLLSGWNTTRASDGSNGGPNQANGALSADASLSGWPTSTSTDAVKQGNVSPRPGTMGLSETVPLAGWPTSTTRDWKDGGNPEVDVPLNALLRRVAWLAGWPTTNAVNGERSAFADYEKFRARKDAGRQQNLQEVVAICGPIRLTAHGQILTGFSAGMASGGQLSPAHSRWLMGFPAAWDYCGAMAMLLCQKKRQRSSRRVRK